MTGLLIKDFRLLKVQKNFFTLIVFILLGMILFSEDNFFAVSFATFIFSLFSTSTVSYDEFDNGNPFLFSLPVTRKGYVLEKYCFGLILRLVCFHTAGGHCSADKRRMISQRKSEIHRHRTDLSSGCSGCKSSGSAAHQPGVSFQQPVIPEYERADFWRDCCHAAPFAAFTENQYGCHEPKRVLTKSCGTTDFLSVPQLFSAIRTKPPADVSVRNLFRYFCNSSAS